MVTEPDRVLSLTDEALQQVVLRELLLSDVDDAHSQLLLRLFGRPIGDGSAPATHQHNGTHALAVADPEQNAATTLPQASVRAFRRR